MDRIRALKTFIAVADAGSLVGAARQLGMSPPTVTRIIGDLESRLGVTLLHRTTRIVTLTAVGDAYLADTRKIVAELDAADDAARGAHSVPTGLLRVTAPALFGQYYVSPVITAYLDRYAGACVDAVFLDRVVNLIEEDVDVAARIGHLQDSGLRAIRVGSVRWSVCGCASYFERAGLPQRPQDLKGHSIVSAGAGPGAVSWRFGGGESVRLLPRLTYSSIAAAIGAAKSGWGLTRVLSYQIGPEIGSGGLQTVLSEYEPDPLPVHIVHTEGRRAPAKVRAFIDMAVERLRADPFLN